MGKHRAEDGGRSSFTSPPTCWRSCCSHGAGEEHPAATKAHPWRRPFPGVDPMQRSCARRWPHLSRSLLTGAHQLALAWVPLQPLWYKAPAQPQKPQPPALSQWPAGEEMFLLVSVAALPWGRLFLWRGVQNIPPIYPRNSNCILLPCLCRPFWEGWDPQDPARGGRTCASSLPAVPPAHTPLPSSRSIAPQFSSLSPCRKPGDGPAHVYARAV